MHQTDEQIHDLQIKMAYLENTIDALNAVITKQDKELQDIKDQLKLIYKQIESNQTTGVSAFDLLADRPPHY